jgi:hypothetical protein
MRNLIREFLCSTLVPAADIEEEGTRGKVRRVFLLVGVHCNRKRTVAGIDGDCERDVCSEQQRSGK